MFDHGDVAQLKARGDLAELMVAADLLRQGHKLALPYGEDWDYDLIVGRDCGALEKVQVKHVRSDGRVVVVKCLSRSLTAGRVRATKRYTAQTVDWIAVWDATSERCYYVPACELGAGRATINLRLDPPANGQRAGVRFAANYLELGPARGRGANGNTRPLQG